MRLKGADCNVFVQPQKGSSVFFPLLHPEVWKAPAVPLLGSAGVYMRRLHTDTDVMMDDDEFVKSTNCTKDIKN